MNKNRILHLLKMFPLWRGRDCYSQMGEDLFLDYYFAQKKKGFYIDIGASHPYFFSNTYKLYKKGWQGLLIEPQKRNCALLRWRNRDKVLNFAVAQKRARVPFFVHKNCSELSALKPIQEHDFAKTIVAAWPLRDIIARLRVKKVDLLSIDTEGNELEVLKSHDWKIKPQIVIVEEHGLNLTKLQSSPIHRYLSPKGYKLTSHYTFSSIYELQARHKTKC